jgi:YidC/Oxa1 family membrane protein insertase
MNKHTIIGLILIFALIIGYSWYISPSEKEREEQRRIQDSIRLAELNNAQADSLSAVYATQEEDERIKTDSLPLDTATKYQQLTEVFGVFTKSSIEVEDTPFVVENDFYRLSLCRKGGKIKSVELKNVKTYDTLPVILFEDNDKTNFGFSFYSNYLELNTNDLYFIPVEDYSKQSLLVSGKDSIEIAMRLYPDKSTEEIDSSSYIEYLYTIRGNDYRTGLKINFVNIFPYINRNQTSVELMWQTQLRQQEQSLKNEMTSTTIYYSDANDVENLKEAPDKGDSLTYTTRLKWISFKQLFFTSTLIADDYFSGGTMVVDLPKEKVDRSLKEMKARLTLPLEGDNSSFGMNFYFGPNKYNTLKQYDINLENQIQLGGKLISWINKYAVIPIFNFFDGFGWNYGLIILILTIIIKTVLFPLTMTNYKSSAKMRVVKPEVEEISKRYPKQEDAMKKQQAIMALYKQAGIKPMAGCLPLLLQMPILIAMFRFFPSSYELRQQSFLWANDLSTYDSVASWDAHIPLISTFYGNHISLFTLLMTLATLAYTILNNKMMSTGGNEQQMKMMKWMMYLMPVLFLGVFNNYSAGLSYYYLLVNLITFAQMGVFRLIIDEKKLQAQIQANRNRSVTKPKSKLQLRMEKFLREQQTARQAKENASLQPKQRKNTSLQNKKKKKR